MHPYAGGALQLRAHLEQGQQGAQRRLGIPVDGLQSGHAAASPASQ